MGNQTEAINYKEIDNKTNKTSRTDKKAPQKEKGS